MGKVQTAASAPEAQWRQAPSGELVDLGLKPGHGPRGFGVIGCFIYAFLFYI